MPGRPKLLQPNLGPTQAGWPIGVCYGEPYGHIVYHCAHVYHYAATAMAIGEGDIVITSSGAWAAQFYFFGGYFLSMSRASYRALSRVPRVCPAYRHIGLYRDPRYIQVVRPL